MASWNGLSKELREEVVKRCDFRTRFLFRHVSKSCQELVDSVPLYIPRVVLAVQSETEAKLTFYTGIEKWIDVSFTKRRFRNTCTVKVTETSHDTITELGSTRNVSSSNAPLLAASTFKHVAMHPNTVCGGVEFHKTRLIDFGSLAAALRFFDDRRYTAKKLLVDCDVHLEFVMRVAIEHLEEITRPHNSDNSYYTATKRMAFRVAPEAVPKERNAFLLITHKLMVTGREDNLDVFSDAYIVKLQRAPSTVHHGPNDISAREFRNGLHLYMRINACGVASLLSKDFMTSENPNACEMRDACPRCADPFEHWYFGKTTPAKYMEDHIRDSMRDKPLYEEAVVPRMNGVCPVGNIMDVWFKEYRKQHLKEALKRGDLFDDGKEKKNAKKPNGGVKDPVLEKIRKGQSERAEMKKRKEAQWKAFMALGAVSIGLAVFLQWFFAK